MHCSVFSLQITVLKVALSKQYCLLPAAVALLPAPTDWQFGTSLQQPATSLAARCSSGTYTVAYNETEVAIMSGT
jgi:hypothetical protein